MLRRGPERPSFRLDQTNPKPVRGSPGPPGSSPGATRISCTAAPAPAFFRTTARRPFFTSSMLPGVAVVTRVCGVVTTLLTLPLASVTGHRCRSDRGDVSGQLEAGGRLLLGDLDLLLFVVRLGLVVVEVEDRSGDTGQDEHDEHADEGRDRRRLFAIATPPAALAASDTSIRSERKWYRRSDPSPNADAGVPGRPGRSLGPPDRRSLRRARTSARVLRCAGLKFSILGPLEVVDDNGRALDLGTPRRARRPGDTRAAHEPRRRRSIG